MAFNLGGILTDTDCGGTPSSAVAVTAGRHAGCHQVVGWVSTFFLNGAVACVTGCNQDDSEPATVGCGQWVFLS